MSVATVLSPAHELALEVTGLIKSGKFDLALTLARQGWRDHPEAELSGGATFERLTGALAGKVKGGVALPAESLTTPAAPVSVVPMSAVPVSAVPVSAVPMSAVPVSAGPVSAVPVSAGPVSTVPVSAVPAVVATVTIERSDSQGTIIKGWDETVKGVLYPLGWKWARMGHFYIGDRHTAPNVEGILAAQSALEAAGVAVVVTVKGDEPAAQERKRPATKRERAATALRVAPVSGVPVSVQPVAVAPVSAVPVAAAPVAPVSAVPVSVSAAPVSPAAPDAVMALMGPVMDQLAAMQRQLAAMATPSVAPAAAPPVAVVAPIVPAASVVAGAVESVGTAAETVDDILRSLLSEQTNACLGLAWKFKVVPGASARKTSEDLRSDLNTRVTGWWPAQRKGSVTFSVRRDSAAPGELIVTVKSVSGEIVPTTLGKQVTGTALTVKGIVGVGRVSR